LRRRIPYGLFLWRYEFQNILATAIKAKQIKPEQALDTWDKVSKVLIENECEPSQSRVIDLVAQYGITAYDGQFIAVALEMGVPLVTEDRELQEKFPGIATSMDEFLRPGSLYFVQEGKARYRKRKA
jgi:predicted nucleic acid-binding protein